MLAIGKEMLKFMGDLISKESIDNSIKGKFGVIKITCRWFIKYLKESNRQSLHIEIKW